MSNKIFRKIKSAGVVDGEFVVLLDDGSYLDGIQFLNVDLGTDRLGTVSLKVIVPQSFKETDTDAP